MEKYITVKKVGSGGFGDAFVVQEKATTKVFLMKSIDLRNLEKSQRVKCFKEVSMLQGLNHPSITKYRESFLFLRWADQPVHVHRYGTGGRR